MTIIARGGNTDCTSGESPRSLGTATRSSRCVSVPYSTAWSYTERPSLLKELREESIKARDGARGRRVIAVTGSGGTGKTQLVLRFVEEHEEEYDIILWIDAQTEETTRSSYERCCRALDLPVDDSPADAPQDLPCLHLVLSMLRSVDGGMKWLVVVDSVDEPSCDVDALIPERDNGTVILCGRVIQTSQLLGRQTVMVKVDSMKADEASTLFLEEVGGLMLQDMACRPLVEKIVKRLNRNARAIELAAAYVQVSILNGKSPTAALRGYLSDYQRVHRRLFLDQDFADADGHGKAVRTACRVSLSSLNEAHEGQPYVFATELIGFMTHLNRARAQDELFRLASLGLEDTRDRLDVRAPPWMRELLKRGEDDEWDDSTYRATARVLWRLRLVTPLGEPWRGIAVHRDVRSQAAMDTADPACWYSYLIFLTAACVQSEKETTEVHFRQQLLAHFLSSEAILGVHSPLHIRGLRWMWSAIGHFLCKAGKWSAAEELVMKVIIASSTSLGEDHPDTISAVANLGTIYCSQERWLEAELLDVKVLEMSARVLGKQHPDTITAMDNLAATYRNVQRWKEEKELRLEILKLKLSVFGKEHPSTLTAMSELAAAYWHAVNCK